MKNKHMTSPSSARLLLGVVIATSVFTASVNAQPSFAGKFTLPYEVRWGQAVLPAGDYVIRMESTVSPAKISPANGISAGVFTMSPVLEDSHSAGTYLTITNQGDQRKVRSLNLPELGKLVIFSPLNKTEREELAKAEQINTVPVVTAKK